MNASRLLVIGIAVSLSLISSVGTRASWLGNLPPGRIGSTAPVESLVFTHGVASSEATSSSALLWTRADQPAILTAQVSADPGFASLVFQQDVTITAETDYTARVLAELLEADHTYYYRWLSGDVSSPTGAFRTAPGETATIPVRFAYSGDSDGTRVLGQPFFNDFEALDAARGDAPDFFVYLGDTVYSDSPLRFGGAAETLAEYRATYRVNRQIAALPDLLAATSIYAIWDDHEVYNDFAGQTVDPVRFDFGRQAFLEYFPIQDDDLPVDAECAGNPLFRIFSWGKDVEIIILDGRSCRSASAASACNLLSLGISDPAPTLPAAERQALGLPAVPPAGCLEAIREPNRTMLGGAQKELFKEALLASQAKFKFVISAVPIQAFYLLPFDRWEGYAAEREEILGFIQEQGIENVIFLAADTHANLVNEVFVDAFSDPEPVASEFVTGPIATATLEDTIKLLPIPGALQKVNDLFDSIGMDCRDLDAYSYGLVEADPLLDQVTVTLKDDAGAPLVNQGDPAVECRQIIQIGGEHNYLPLTHKQ